MGSCRHHILTLLWRCITLRKKNWLISLFELALPIIIIAMCNASINQGSGRSGNATVLNLNHVSYSQLSASVGYTPSNEFTDEIMTGFFNNSERSGLTSLPGFEKPLGEKSEADLEQWLYSSMQGFPGRLESIGIVFLVTNRSNNIFKYKIRSNAPHLTMNNDTLSYEYGYDQSDFVQVQFILDRELLRSIDHDVSYNIYFGKFSNTEQYTQLLDDFNLVYVCVCMMYAVHIVSLIKEIVAENNSGLKEMMLAMGVSTRIIWAHWFLYAMIMHLITSIPLSMFLATVISRYTITNVCIIWVLICLFSISVILFQLISSNFFSSSFTGIIVSLVIWIVIHIVSMKILTSRAGFYFWGFMTLYSLLPLNNIYLAISSMKSFKGEWSIAELFDVGASNDYEYGSVGLALLTCIIEIIFLLCCLEYFITLTPGLISLSRQIISIMHFSKTRKRSSVKFFSVAERISGLDRFEPPSMGLNVLITFEDVHKTYGRLIKVSAVEHLDLDIYEKETVILLGAHKAGKSTILSMMIGLLTPTSGIIKFDGRDIRNIPTYYRDSLGYCTQYNFYIPKFTVSEHFWFFGMLKGMSCTEIKSQRSQLLHELNLIHIKSVQVKKLSEQQKRLLCLSISLLGSPKILILDGPTTALDNESKQDVWNAINNRRGQCTMLIASEFMEEANILGDRIVILDRGKVVFYGTPAYMKKIYGTGYHIRVTKRPEADPGKISSLFSKILKTEPQVNIISSDQIKFTLKEDYLVMFPDLFEALETQSNSLGIIDASVHCTTLEEVFQKVRKTSTHFDDGLIFTSNGSFENKADGCQLLAQQVEAFIRRYLIYRKRKIYPLLLIVSFLIILTILMVDVVQRMEQKLSIPSCDNCPIKIDLTLYPNSSNVIVFDDKNKNIANTAIRLIKKQSGKIIALHSGTPYNISNKLSSKNVQPLLSLQFLNDYIVTQYKGINHVAPVAANLISNILLNNITKGIIEVTNHPYVPPETSVCHFNVIYSVEIISITWGSFTSFQICCLLFYFLIYPIEERASGFKRQQLMTGSSPFLYWTVNIVLDLILFVCSYTVILITFITFASHVVLRYLIRSSAALFALVLLSGLSGLSSLYLLSQLFNSIIWSSLVYLLTHGFLNMLFVYVFISMSELGSLGHYFLFVVAGFSFNPIFATFGSTYGIVYALVSNSLCYKCKDEDICTLANQPLFSLPNENNKHGILIYFLMSLLSFVLYSSMTLLIDFEIIRKVLLLLTYKPGTFCSYSQQYLQDEDVTLERERAKSCDEENIILKVYGILKTFSTKPTVENVSFTVSDGECFGILGASKSGKTTLFNILTGFIRPDCGYATIYKTSVITNSRKYQELIGYCTEWDEYLNILTGEEILTVIALLRGVPKCDVKAEVKGWVQFIGTEEAKDRSEEYDSATKRKLSVAIAFIGDPAVVILDEPTTGVDPVLRRSLWRCIIQRQRTDQAVVLFSTSMEECAEVCDRLTILRDGRMICIGTPNYLKQKFSQGYSVIFKLSSATPFELERLKENVLVSFPKSVIVNEQRTVIHYQILERRIDLSKMFYELVKIKDKYSFVEDLTVSNTSLEQLFLSFTKTFKRPNKQRRSTIWQT